jgi:hypothetical protein
MMEMSIPIQIGHPPWCPSPDAEIVDVWDKYDFYLEGYFRLGDDLIIFRLADPGCRGNWSRWEYVRAVPGGPEGIAGLRRFDTKAEWDAWLDNCYDGQEVVTAEAEDFVIISVGTG